MAEPLSRRQLYHYLTNFSGSLEEAVSAFKTGLPIYFRLDNGLELAYDERQFRENPAGYAARQLEAHSYHHDVMKKMLAADYAVLNTCFEVESRMARNTQLLFEDEVRQRLLMFKIKAFFSCLLQFTTPKRQINDRILIFTREHAVSRLIRDEVIGKGRDFLAGCAAEPSIPADAKPKLCECVEIAQSLYSGYCRHCEAQERFVRANQKLYDFLYPLSK